MEIPPGVSDVIRRALEEDIGSGDITSILIIPQKSRSRAAFIAKADFILAGIPFSREVFRQLDSRVTLKAFFKEGAAVRRNDVIAEVSAKTRSILAGERVSLNILQRLSGIATLTRMFVDRISGTKAKILDTRKTTPCQRFMEKYAVRIGGGYNHRFGLFDGILIKDNHIKSAGNIRKAVECARHGHHLLKIEVEVGNLRDLERAIEAGADIVMLDNMSLEKMRDAVETAGGRVLLEASGGIMLENVRQVAETGVDLISIGALTHSAVAADISLNIID
ncbi:MAG: carboxylating nicotinate-nucleotide diphosphorylase [Nitrospirota bacterium]